MLPADFESNDSGAEVFTMSLEKRKSVSYRSSSRKMQALDENEETFGNSTLDSPSHRKDSYNDDDDAAGDDDDRNECSNDDDDADAGHDVTSCCNARRNVFTRFVERS